MPDRKTDGLVASGMQGGKPAEPSLPKLNVCGDIGLKIARDGTWFYEGSPIGRKPLVKLFSTVLRREEDGFFLVTPVERVPIEVEAEPFIAVAMSREGEGDSQRLSFTTNVDDEVIAGPQHAIGFCAEPEGGYAPYIEVRDGLRARLARAVYYELADMVVRGDDGYGVWSGGLFFPFPIET